MPQSKSTPYPLNICVDMLHYCYISNRKTESMKASEIKDNLRIFFTDEEIEKAQKILTGKA